MIINNTINNNVNITITVCGQTRRFRRTYSFAQYLIENYFQNPNMEDRVYHSRIELFIRDNARCMMRIRETLNVTGDITSECVHQIAIRIMMNWREYANNILADAVISTYEECWNGYSASENWNDMGEYNQRDSVETIINYLNCGITFEMYSTNAVMSLVQSAMDDMSESTIA